MQDVNFESCKYLASDTPAMWQAQFQTDLPMQVLLLMFILGLTTHTKWDEVLRCPQGFRPGTEMCPLLPLLDRNGVPTGASISRTVAVEPDMVQELHGRAEAGL